MWVSRRNLKSSGVAVVATVLLASGVHADGQAVTIAPFEVLESYPGCIGSGKTAYRVSFETRAKARFGIDGVAFSPVCEIRTRKGSDVIDQQIPCPDMETNPARESLVEKLPRTVNISADVVGCLELTSHKFLRAEWALSGETVLGRVEERGNLESNGLILLFEGPNSVGPPLTGTSIHFSGVRVSRYALLGMVFDNMRVSQPKSGGDYLSVASYLVVAAEEPYEQWCYSERCEESPLSADWLMRNMGWARFGKIVDLVERE